MKTFAAVVAVVAGIVVTAVPRFVFPTCEYLGRGRMHCSDLARGEYAVGGLLVAVGVALALLSGRGAVASAGAGVLLCAAAAALPAYTRYCMNPDMPCHYGMVPTLRFVGALSGLALAVALVSLLRESRSQP